MAHRVAKERYKAPSKMLLVTDRAKINSKTMMETQYRSPYFKQLHYLQTITQSVPRYGLT